MNRRDFIISGATISAGILLLTPGLARSFEDPSRNRLPLRGYRMHGNKRLGCAGFDFPDDPSLLESGQFMPNPQF
jgi:hypothetical protein